MSMRMIALVVAVGLVAAVAAVAGDEASNPAAGKTHDITVQVLSVDRRSKNITIRNEKGGTESLAVLGDAGRHLGMLRTGGMFTLTCQDNEKGEHQGIIAIKTAKPATK